MVLDSRIMAVRDWWGIWTFDEWQRLKPEDVLRVPNVGPATLAHIRLYLAGHGVTLAGDRTPEFWQKHSKQVQVVQQIADTDEPIVCDFTILIDSAEQQPFAFDRIRCGRGKNANRLLLVPTEWQSLGRHPDSLGDYSIKGFVGRVHVERKSVEDCQNTILGWDGARERFEAELFNLSKIEAPLVVVEGSVDQVLSEANGRRKTKPSVQAKQLMRSIIALQQDYAVPWMFCSSRQMAELWTFRHLERFWRKQQEAAKEEAKQQKELVTADDVPF